MSLTFVMKANNLCMTKIYYFYELAINKLPKTIYLASKKYENLDNPFNSVVACHLAGIDSLTPWMSG